MDPILFILLSIVLIGVASYLAALPILRQARQFPDGNITVSSEQERLDELVSQRESAFQALRELNFDHRVGKVTDDDFTAFEMGLKQAAADALRALDEWESEADDELDRALEQAVSTRRQALAGPQSAGRSDRVCAACGRPALAEDRFCGGCGAALDAALDAPPSAVPLASRCPQCGQELAADDRFCGGCGQSIPVSAVAEKS